MLLVFACLVSAGEQAAHWSDLSRVLAGRDVILGLQNGKRVKGSAVAVAADSIAAASMNGAT